MYFATPGRTCPVCGEGIDYELPEDDEQDEEYEND
jgi:predicted nucleic acid-binding Zn ribbon protein